MRRQGRAIFIHVGIWLYGVVFGQLHAILPKNLAKWNPAILGVTPAWQPCYIVLVYFQHIGITDLQFDQRNSVNQGQKQRAYENKNAEILGIQCSYPCIKMVGEEKTNRRK